MFDYKDANGLTVKKNWENAYNIYTDLKQPGVVKIA